MINVCKKGYMLQILIPHLNNRYVLMEVYIPFNILTNPQIYFPTNKKTFWIFTKLVMQ